MMNVLSLQNVVKAYANHVAVNNVSFDVKAGSIFGLLGPNGAGKTSLIRIITTITAADSAACRARAGRRSRHAGPRSRAAPRRSRRRPLRSLRGQMRMRRSSRAAQQPLRADRSRQPAWFISERCARQRS